MSTDTQIDIESCDIIKYYSTIKKKEILPFVTTWMDFEGTMLSEISQTEKNK